MITQKQKLKDRIEELEVQLDDAEFALSQARKEAAEERITANDLFTAWRTAMDFIGSIGAVFMDDATVNERPVSDLPQVVQDKITELNDMKVRIRQFVWEMK